ncbi:MAG: hypothetical protein Hens3KO_00090 [Henriciella sp.]
MPLKSKNIIEGLSKLKNTIELKSLSGLLACTALSVAIPASIANAQVTNFLDLPSVATDKLPPAGWPDLDWFDPGGWTVIDVSANGLPPNSSTTDASAAISLILDNNPTGRLILFFPEGAYYLQDDLNIDRNNVILRGAGPEDTIFRMVAPDFVEQSINFEGSASGSPISVTSAISRGDSTITIADASSLAVSDFISVYRDKYRNGLPFEGQIVRVSAINGNDVTVDMKLGLDYDTTAFVEKLNIIKSVGVEDLRIIRRQDNSGISVNLRFQYAFNVFVKNIESYYTGNNHLRFDFARDAFISENKIHHSFDYGGGGHGYGAVLANLTTRGYIWNNKFWSLRHQILFSNGANHSVVSYNSSAGPRIGTNNDLDIHGWSPNNNLWEGNNGYNLVSDQRSDPNQDTYQGLFNTYYRNWINNDITVMTPDDSGNNPAEDYVIVGNIADDIVTQSGTVGVFEGANILSGVETYGALSSSDEFPTSLYQTSKPSFLGTKPWPLYGPELGTGWGKDTKVPAGDLARTSMYEVEDIRSTLVNAVGATVTTFVDHPGAMAGEIIKLNADSIGDYVDLTLESVQTGTYEVRVRQKRHGSRGKWSLKIGGTTIGNEVDGYGSGYETVSLGTVTFSQTDDQTLRFEVTGQNTLSSGYNIVLDQIELVLQ